MSLDAKTTDDRPLTKVSELLETFHGAERPTGGLLLGLEHEKFIVPREGLHAVPYDGPAGINAVLTGFKQFGWQEFRERDGGPIIAMTRGQAALSLEPGGQFELSGAPFVTAREANAENEQHAHELRVVTDALGLRVVAMGYRPYDTLGAMPWMPKSRYGAMRPMLGARGSHAHHMMLMTATGQASFDWRDEADCARKVTAASRISPLLVALYANSPLVEGKPSGFQSFRSRVWNDVDAARCGYFAGMLDGSFSYQAYVDWALEAPMLFLRRRGQYLTPQLTFRRLLEDGFEGSPATSTDWTDHLSTLFPEVRIKRVIEIRAADGSSVAMTGALGALMRGLFYDQAALTEAFELMPRATFAEHLALHRLAQREGLHGQWQGRTLLAWAAELVAIAARGLGRLDPLDAPLLAPLHEVVASGRSGADRVLEAATRSSPSDVLNGAPL